METLPNEILQKIFHSLSFQDCRRVCSTSSRLYNLLPLVVSSLDVSSLTIIRQENLPTVDFLAKHNLSSSVKSISFNINLLQDVDFTESLKAVFNACHNLEKLHVDSHDVIQSVPIPSWTINLDELLGGKTIREVHCGVNQIPPESAIKCTVNCDTLVEMFFAYQKRLPTAQNVPSFLKSLTMTFEEGYRRYYGEHEYRTRHPIWDALGCRMLSSLEELSLVSYFKTHPCDSFLPVMGGDTEQSNPQENVKRLNISAPVFGRDIRTLLFDVFPNVVSLTLRIDLGDDLRYAFLDPLPFAFPPSIKELYLLGTFHGQMRDRNNLWKYLFECLWQNPRPNLEMITQDYQFEGDFTQTVAPKLSPAFVNRFKELKPGLFRDLYFHLDRPGDWHALVSLLRNCASLDHLYIHVWFYNETQADQVIRVAETWAHLAHCVSFIQLM